MLTTGPRIPSVVAPTNPYPLCDATADVEVTPSDIGGWDMSTLCTAGESETGSGSQVLYSRFLPSNNVKPLSSQDCSAASEWWDGPVHHGTSFQTSLASDSADELSKTCDNASTPACPVDLPPISGVSVSTSSLLTETIMCGEGTVPSGPTLVDQGSPPQALHASGSPGVFGQQSAAPPGGNLDTHDAGYAFTAWPQAEVLEPGIEICERSPSSYAFDCGQSNDTELGDGWTSQAYRLANDHHTTSVRRRAASRSPVRNGHGEIHCDHQECSLEPPIFRRRCDWNRHMERHERPYHCDIAGCGTSPGFSSARGLLRHQREVH